MHLLLIIKTGRLDILKTSPYAYNNCLFHILKQIKGKPFMKKIFFRFKRIIIFFLLAAIVPWMNIALLLAFAPYDTDQELNQLVLDNSSTIYNNFYTGSLWAFIITYVIALQVINKKTNKKLWRTIWYFITYFSSFLLLLLIPYPE